MLNLVCTQYQHIQQSQSGLSRLSVMSDSERWSWGLILQHTPSASFLLACRSRPVSSKVGWITIHGKGCLGGTFFRLPALWSWLLPACKALQLSVAGEVLLKEYSHHHLDDKFCRVPRVLSFSFSSQPRQSSLFAQWRGMVAANQTTGRCWGHPWLSTPLSSQSREKPC